MADRTLTVNIIGDDRSLQAALNRSTASVARFDRQQQAVNARSAALGQASRGISSQLGGGTAALFGSAQFVAAALATAAIKRTVDAASDLNEQISKSNVVFGESAKVISDWSETTATSIGISRRAAIAAAATFGSIFVNTGRSKQDAAEFSKTLVNLAGDLASFNNASTDDALTALRSGLSGEIEPLRRFQVFLTEASVAQEAMAETGKTNVRQLTQGEKILARYNLILRQTKIQQGDYARTSQGLANQQRTLAAQVDDLAASMGQVLIPAATSLVGALNDAIVAGRQLADVLGDLARLPGIEIPVKVVSNVAGGRGGDILKHIILGGISPLALGITIGSEIADGIRQGVEGAAAITSPGEGRHGGSAGAIGRARAASDEVARANAIIASIERQVAAQKDLNRQLSDSEKREAHLRDLIREDPDNVRLQSRLRAELEKQASLRFQIQASSEAAARAAASSAASAKAEAEAAAATRKEHERDAAIRRQQARNSRQFLALGLTADGDVRTPGVGALRRRASNLEDQIKGTVLDTAKTRTQLQRIARVLSGAFGKVGKDVRQAILGMLNDISNALNGGSSGDLNRGNLTKFRVVNTSNILAGLGLSEQETMELRRRLSRLGPGGTMPQNTTTGGAFGFNTGTGGRQPPGHGNVIINGDVYVNANDADHFRRSLERRQQRNAGVRSGPNATRRKN